MDKKKYKTLAPLYFLKKENYKEMKKICPYLNQSSSPTSYYIKKLINFNLTNYFLLILFFF